MGEVKNLALIKKLLEFPMDTDVHIMTGYDGDEASTDIKVEWQDKKWPGNETGIFIVDDPGF